MINFESAKITLKDGASLKFLEASLEDMAQALAINKSDVWHNPLVESISRIKLDNHIEVPEIGLFALTIQYSNGEPEHGILSWIDSPISKCDWETVTPSDLYETVLGLSAAVEILFRSSPSKKQKNLIVHNTQWGNIRISGETRSYSVGAYLFPNKRKSRDRFESRS